ncbi:acetoacetyl-CoA synthetase [Trichonephila clavipes]|nr:acetoacetyl-CoA synthetase [Trichonephila clavipes]
MTHLLMKENLCIETAQSLVSSSPDLITTCLLILITNESTEDKPKMNHRNFNNVQVMRMPKENEGIQLKKFQKIIQDKYNAKFNDYWDFHRWTIDNLAEFWAELWDFVGVIDLSVPMEESPEWFKGARLNFAENLLKYRDDKVAIISAGEDKETEYITFAQMYEEAKLYAAAFRKFGLKKEMLLHAICLIAKNPCLLCKRPLALELFGLELCHFWDQRLS